MVVVPEPPLLFFFFGALEPLPEPDDVDGDGLLCTGGEYVGVELTVGVEVTVGVDEVTVGAGGGDDLAGWRR
jgi:hypothetical protein